MKETGWSAVVSGLTSFAATHPGQGLSPTRQSWILSPTEKNLKKDQSSKSYVTGSDFLPKRKKQSKIKEMMEVYKKVCGKGQRLALPNCNHSAASWALRHIAANVTWNHRWLQGEDGGTGGQIRARLQNQNAGSCSKRKIRCQGKFRPKRGGVNCESRD